MGMLMLEKVEDNNVTNILLMKKEKCALKLVDEIYIYIYIYICFRDLF